MGVSRLFKNKVREIWEKWMTDNMHTTIKSGRGGVICLNSYAKEAEYVKDTWDAVTELKDVF